jgi:5-methyltetrahydrofolate--homocysteine methyltransferase
VLDEDGNELKVFETLRQQKDKGEGSINYALSDFLAPGSANVKDYVGVFTVTAGLGLENWIKQFEDEHDDYSSILAKALADRLAEAFAEYLHERIRKDFWGYAQGETLENQELIKEKYRGIRPAPGYPACPDHLEKQTLFDLLETQERTGAFLTESMAMFPAASVSGYYFAHPEARYFALGRIDEDQLQDYAERKGIDREEARKWLAPNLKD